MNTTISILIMKTWVLSPISLAKFSFIKSSVRVELDAITRDDSVDMDAESTSSTTRAMSMSGSPDTIAGIIESYPSASIFT